MGWDAGVTKISSYRCIPITTACIVIRRLVYPCWWVDLEVVFGMRASVMSEVFWEVIETFYGKQHQLVTVLSGDLPDKRSAQYAEAVGHAGGRLENCAGFIDCTKLQMCRPRSANMNN